MRNKIKYRKSKSVSVELRIGGVVPLSKAPIPSFWASETDSSCRSTTTSIACQYIDRLNPLCMNQPLGRVHLDAKS